MSHENREIVREAMTAFNQHDRSAWLALKAVLG
jgi:hypothetical protein